jgi:topoisomerase-4 subunit B
VDNLRYNNVVIATDADVDGMHIRLLLMTFFLQFFPDLVKKGHLYVLNTPLFRVRDKKETIYCYSEQEKLKAIEKLRGKPEITRFKGLGEISPSEFGQFIGQDIRLEPVLLKSNQSIEQLLEYYMGKNTPDRQTFIINNLKIEKDEVMERFAAGEVNILCATSVVEVGVNVPNATVIIIEGAERFGLAQLHQLRGRVIRSSDQAYCYLFSETKGEKTFERLKALTTAKNGFELSEMDLTLRGAGELGGGKQWGISDIGMEAIKNIKMVEAAREEAKRLLTEDISLSHYPSILARLSEREKPTHFE